MKFYHNADLGKTGAFKNLVSITGRLVVVVDRLSN